MALAKTRYLIPLPPGGVFLAELHSLGLTPAQAEALAEAKDPHLSAFINRIANEQMNRLSTVQPAGNC